MDVGDIASTFGAFAGGVYLLELVLGRQRLKKAAFAPLSVLWELLVQLRRIVGALRRRQRLAIELFLELAVGVLIGVLSMLFVWLVVRFGLGIDVTEHLGPLGAGAAGLGVALWQYRIRGKVVPKDK